MESKILTDLITTRNEMYTKQTSEVFKLMEPTINEIVSHQFGLFYDEVVWKEIDVASKEYMETMNIDSESLVAVGYVKDSLVEEEMQMVHLIIPLKICFEKPETVRLWCAEKCTTYDDRKSQNNDTNWN